jgi:hypothetical protein
MHEAHDHEPPDRTIPTTCQIHGCRGFCNLRVSKIDGEIVLNSHVDGSCVLRLDRTAATQLLTLLRSGWDDLVSAISERSAHTAATCAVAGSSPRAAWNSHHSGHGGKVAQLCRRVTAPACPVDRPPLSSRPGRTGQKAVTDEDRQLLSICGV